MKGAAGFSVPQHKAAVASYILGVIFDDLTALDHLPYFSCANHAVRSVHLPKRMRQVEAPLFRSLQNPRKNFALVIHDNRLHRDRRLFNPFDVANAGHTWYFRVLWPVEPSWGSALPGVLFCISIFFFSCIFFFFCYNHLAVPPTLCSIRAATGHWEYVGVGQCPLPRSDASSNPGP